MKLLSRIQYLLWSVQKKKDIWKGRIRICQKYRTLSCIGLRLVLFLYTDEFVCLTSGERQRRSAWRRSRCCEFIFNCCSNVDRPLVFVYCRWLLCSVVDLFVFYCISQAVINGGANQALWYRIARTVPEAANHMV